MFYQAEANFARAAIVLRPEESKKLLARAVVKMAEVRTALREGMLIIAGGTTNAYIAREISNQDIDIYRYTAGRIYQGKLTATPEEERIKPLILIKGKIADISLEEALKSFAGTDVFLKGANAVDAEGNVGVLAANPQGGTVGASWAIVRARGGHLICPVGLEKLIPSVQKACEESGQERFQLSMGYKVSLMPLAGAKVVTEIQALKILYDLEATHIASGGILGSEGAVVLSVKGERDNLELMWKEMDYIKSQE